MAALPERNCVRVLFQEREKFSSVDARGKKQSRSKESFGQTSVCK